MKAPKIVTLRAVSELGNEDHPLRRVCPKFDFGEESIEEVADRLRDAIRAYDVAVGFAAPQIGIDRRVVIVNHKKKSLEHERLLVNPVILEVGAEAVAKFESCMSLPGWRGRLLRPSYVKAEFWDERGERQTIEADGFLARVLLHEVDHLNGVLFADRLSSADALEAVPATNE